MQSLANKIKEQLANSITGIMNNGGSGNLRASVTSDKSDKIKAIIEKTPKKKVSIKITKEEVK